MRRTTVVLSLALLLPRGVVGDCYDPTRREYLDRGSKCPSGCCGDDGVCAEDCFPWMAVGLAVGLVLLVCTVFGVCCCWCRRRRSSIVAKRAASVSSRTAPYPTGRASASEDVVVGIPVPGHVILPSDEPRIGTAPTDGEPASESPDSGR
ncbi:hypothetical protein DIPPA_04846, partial [Diplonema papillatum]